MKPEEQQHQDCTNRFIELANEMKNEGVDISLVSGSMMTASGIYATFVAAGNNGTLEASGVKKVVDMYRHMLEKFQRIKKDELMQKHFN